MSAVITPDARSEVKERLKNAVSKGESIYRLFIGISERSAREILYYEDRIKTHWYNAYVESKKDILSAYHAAAGTGKTFSKDAGFEEHSRNIVKEARGSLMAFIDGLSSHEIDSVWIKIKQVKK